MGVCDVPVISTVCDVAGEAAATVVAAPFDWLAQAMGGAAGWLIEAMWSVFDTTTLVDVQTDGFTSVYNLIFGIGVFLVLIFFCLLSVVCAFGFSDLLGGAPSSLTGPSPRCGAAFFFQFSCY